MWWDLICKDMKEVQIYCEEYSYEFVELKVFHKIDCQMIFDVKTVNNSRHKAILVSVGHTIEAPSSIT